MHPTRIKEAERILLLMSNLAGLNINGVFTKPDTPTSGGDLALEISFTRASSAVISDNMGSNRLGPLQLAATANFNDVFWIFETTGFISLTVPTSPETLLFTQVTQDIPIGTDGVHVGYRLSYLSFRPSAALRPLDVEVAATSGTLFLIYPFLRTIEQSLFGRAEFNFRNNDLDIGREARARDYERWLAASSRYIAGLEGG
jgi:hemolysin activation/secretion protein